MELCLMLVAVLVALGVPGGASAIVEDVSLMAPLEAARVAVEEYNQGPGVQAVFRLLKLKNIHKTRFGWGVHFSMNFTIKETHCQKMSSYRIGVCKYKANGAIKDCSTEVSILSVMQDSPLASVRCQPAKRSGRKQKPNSQPQGLQALSPERVEHYFPSSYSTAALTAILGE